MVAGSPGLPGVFCGEEHGEDSRDAAPTVTGSKSLPDLRRAAQARGWISHGMAQASSARRKEGSPENVRKKETQKKMAKRGPGQTRSSVSMDEQGAPRLKDAPGLYRIVKEVTAIRYLPGMDNTPRLRRATTILAQTAAERFVDFVPAFPWKKKILRNRLFKPVVFLPEELVHILEVEMKNGFVYGKVEEANGWITLIASGRHHLKTEAWANKVSLKEQVRMTLDKPVYEVTDFYKTEGSWQALARNHLFENVTLLVISVNAIWMAYDADENPAESLTDAQPLFQIAEHFFCIYFSFEWSVRFMAFEQKKWGLRDRWFVFDTCLVFMMVIETWVMTTILLITGVSMPGGGGQSSLLRLFRLLRLSRLARMLRSMPELMIMIKGIVAAFRSVFLAVVLLVLLMYIFAIMFRQLTNGTEVGDVFFSSMGQTMYVLLMSGTFLEDLYDVMNQLGAASFAYAAIFLLFILLSALTVMNMLIGILCEVVAAVAKVEKEQMLLDFVKVKMEEIMAELDDDLNGKITKHEFGKILCKPQAVHILSETGVDVKTLVDYADFIFEAEDGEDKELSLKQFMDVVLSFRSCNTATVKDAVDIRKWIGKSFKRLDEQLRHHISSLNGRDLLGGSPGWSPRGPPSSSMQAMLSTAADRAEIGATVARLCRLDAFFAAVSGELALLSADLMPSARFAAVASTSRGSRPQTRRPPSSVPAPQTPPGTPDEQLPVSGPPARHSQLLSLVSFVDSPTCSSYGPGWLLGTPVAPDEPVLPTVLPPSPSPLPLFASAELGSRLTRLEQFGNLAWGELQRLEGPLKVTPLSPRSDALEPDRIRLWRATVEEFFLAAWTDGLNRMRCFAIHADSLQEVAEMQGCISELLFVLRARQTGLRAVLDALDEVPMSPKHPRHPMKAE